MRIIEANFELGFANRKNFELLMVQIQNKFNWLFDKLAIEKIDTKHGSKRKWILWSTKSYHRIECYDKKISLIIKPSVNTLLPEFFCNSFSDVIQKFISIGNLSDCISSLKLEFNGVMLCDDPIAEMNKYYNGILEGVNDLQFEYINNFMDGMEMAHRLQVVESCFSDELKDNVPSVFYKREMLAYNKEDNIFMSFADLENIVNAYFKEYMSSENFRKINN